MELKDKVVVITGGTKGLGKALAKSFMEEKSKVVVCARKEDEFKNLPSEIFGIKADVVREEDLIKLSKEVVEKFGQIDIWINNAGVWIPRDFVENFDMEKVKKMFDVNTFGTINGSRVALRLMKEKGSGIIINIISDSALIGRPMSSAYVASKWAISGFTKSIREENKNLSIFSIYPGGIKTDIFEENKPLNYDDFMGAEDVAKKIIENLKLEKPLEELVIQK